jgi:hypothetical protein
MAHRHSEEFRREAVCIALTSGLTRKQVASGQWPGNDLAHPAYRLWSSVFAEERHMATQRLSLSVLPAPPGRYLFRPTLTPDQQLRLVLRAR